MNKQTKATAHSTPRPSPVLAGEFPDNTPVPSLGATPAIVAVPRPRGGGGGGGNAAGTPVVYGNCRGGGVVSEQVPGLTRADVAVQPVVGVVDR